jgi:N-acetyl sugar amidotransferase
MEKQSTESEILNNQIDKELKKSFISSSSKDKKTCSRCLFDEDTPSISFDENGVCNYCKMYDQLNEEYPTGNKGWQILQGIADEIKKAGKGKKYDCVVGVSGGCDSSYLVYIAKEKLGLRPLAVHYDNTWNSTIATENIKVVLKKLNVDLFTYVVDNKEVDDIFRSFMKAGVPEIDSATDIGLAAVLYIAAEKYGIKYILEGHSFRTEGVAPLGWAYTDGMYIKDIQKKFGTYKLKTFPNMTLVKFLKWIAIRQIRKIRPLYFIQYDKEEIKNFLKENFGWNWYGGHHLENRFCAFGLSYYWQRKFKIDHRRNGFSALIRSGQMSKEHGLELLEKPPYLEPEIIDLVKKRLRFSDKEFEDIINSPTKSYRDYRTYKPTFIKLKPFFYLMYKMNLVTKSFYIKYTSKNDV